MRRKFQDEPSQPLESREPKAAIPPPPTMHHSNSKRLTPLHGHYLPQLCRPILWYLLIAFLLLTFLHYKQARTSISRTAICLVGGARRFELTGPTILEHVLNVLPEADLFVHSNLDENTFKLALLRSAPRVTEMRIRRPVRFRETEGHMRLLSAGSSPNGIQGLLQYFDLVEGCLNMIAAYETQGNFTYDWILRTRVDGYWTGPLDIKAFKTDSYVVPEGSRYGGLNDRLGIGNRSISAVALSRLSLLPNLALAGFSDLNSESAFHAQLKVFNIPAEELRFPFCILSDRQYKYPPSGDIAPVASIASPGPLSGAKCRPCVPHCKGECIEKLGPEKWLGWTEWRNGSLELCDGSQPWQEGWEEFFDKVADKVTADMRHKVKEMTTEVCWQDMKGLKKNAGRWNGPDPIEICNLGSTSQ
ncbi:hypothetical protein LUZ63_008429 [Rhynchospora breviuscula]|uniref:DUF7796 domain-containing protein n=1 Tax=Rhynchospora breviuscula TaxID=2022672 RepID=A0A9Q0CTL3_9POAL|nr:hypothetical protein LUZ63_008429 [Rhynchospora breviuscula]